MIEEPYARIGRELKAHFIRKGLSQEEIAKTLNVSQQYISAMLNGRPFGKGTARKWATAFGLNSSWLITGEGSMFPLDKRLTTDMMVEEPEMQYNSHLTVGRLNVLLAEKDVQISRLLSIIEEQAATIRILHQGQQ